eukprot:5638074-Heterocapsa_arctica.AAC.1
MKLASLAGDTDFEKNGDEIKKSLQKGTPATGVIPATGKSEMDGKGPSDQRSNGVRDEDGPYTGESQETPAKIHGGGRPDETVART